MDPVWTGHLRTRPVGSLLQIQARSWREEQGKEGFYIENSSTQRCRRMATPGKGSGLHLLTSEDRPQDPHPNPYLQPSPSLTAPHSDGGVHVHTTQGRSPKSQPGSLPRGQALSPPGMKRGYTPGGHLTSTALSPALGHPSPACSAWLTPLTRESPQCFSEPGPCDGKPEVLA